MKKIFALFLFFLPLLLPVPVSATRGCCSWHGGVCGCDTSVGRQICCDGTYSPSCTCAYIPKTPVDVKPKFSGVTASWNFFSRPNKTWKVEFDLNDDKPTKYSAVISKCAGCDPGPLVDFTSNRFVFDNVLPGKWYVNVKKSINSVWSEVVYWTIEVPEWVEPTPTQPSFSNSNEIKTANAMDSDKDVGAYGSFSKSIKLLLSLFFLYFLYLVGKRV